ncbi:acyl-CoA thioesterase/bile acid-CoA:amino acid N-acyltransferase family protein [Rhodococcus sp. IEGM 1307]|uniref:acyl-CoA thioesterase/bile acid-CoA:amino acid N-acyltransferase family protein n=1 Tax=Rhodococcus sp. IEGM 1307 TaxID=3047091 RepID=UPI0024B84CEC|nr:acyl-CoA thioesterase/bile acid-CoA:amino acid N-acyltransferase family protein [Rhodococcus sp. IEGM 1307]MDI9973072.1 acyl-CoA thioesterase/bile acid-CoA:amino acid N-acyltransferase family protein [Rhodococcus sp. IEGM 1307]
MGFIIGFAPWIVYWILVGNTGFVAAVAIAFGIAAIGQVVQRLRGQPWRTLEVGTVAVFALLLIAALTLDDAVLERWLQPVSNFGLFAIAAVGVLIGRPFVREYAVATVDARTAASGGFRYITTAMTWMWVAAFGLMTVFSLIPPIVDGDATMRDAGDTLSVVCYWVLPFTLMGVAGLVSAVFPGWFEKRSQLLETQSSAEPAVAEQPAPAADVSAGLLELDVPAWSRHDEAFSLIVRGARPGSSVTVRTTGTDVFGGRWRSEATFTVPADGTVDVAGQVPDHGDWDVADADAPLWAMRFVSEDRVPDLFVPPPDTWLVTVEASTPDGTSRRTVTRHVSAPGVSVRSLDVGGRPALLALPAGDAPSGGWPGVACFGGSEGGVDSQRSTIGMLAANGYAALAYSWVDESNTDATLVNIPLERFTAAVEALGAQPSVDANRLTAMAISRGAEGLLASACVGELPVAGLILISPSSVSWQAIGPDGEIAGTPSWTWNGRHVPWAPLPGGVLMPQLIRNAWRAHHDLTAHRPSLLRLGAAYRAGLAAAPAEATLRSEQATASVLCLTGADDQLWPSDEMATALLGRRSDARDEHRTFDGAGHLLRLGMFPADAQWTGGIAFGGGGAGQGQAQRESVHSVLGFLARTTAVARA